MRASIRPEMYARAAIDMFAASVCLQLCWSPPAEAKQPRFETDPAIAAKATAFC